MSEIHIVGFYVSDYDDSSSGNIKAFYDLEKAEALKAHLEARLEKLKEAQSIF